MYRITSYNVCYTKLLRLAGLAVKAGDRPLFSGLDLILRKGERIGILGPNGCGKTTLLRTILGEIPPSAGTVVLGKNTRIGYLDQARSDDFQALARDLVV